MKNNENKELNKKQRLYLIIASILAIIAIVVCVYMWLVQKGEIGNKNIYDTPVNKNFSFLVDNDLEELYNDDIMSSQYEIYNNILK